MPWIFFMAKRKSSKTGRKVTVEVTADQAGRGPAAPSKKRSSQSTWQRDVARRFREEGRPVIPFTDHVGWLIAAAEDGRLDEVTRFVELGADVNAQHLQFFDHTPLSLAAIKGDLDVVRYLVEHGADVNRPNSAGITALAIAILHGHLALVKYLVEHGADINHSGKDGDALSYALGCRQIAVYEYLKPLASRRQQLIGGRRLPEAMRPEADTVQIRRLAEMCSRGLIATVRRLLKRGVDVNARTIVYKGLTPLSLAARNGHTDIVKLLLEAGADPNVESYEGRTPLMQVANGNICRMLLAAGADARAVDDERCTVLMWLTDAECCRLLLEAGAKADALDISSRGVLRKTAWWAKRRQDFSWLRSVIDARYDRNLAEIFRLLIAAGAKLDPPAEDGDTALKLLAGLRVPEAKQVLSSAPIRTTKKKARA
jgi:ankyrin repeat protein